jgi:hypothetical protein
VLPSNVDGGIAHRHVGGSSCCSSPFNRERHPDQNSLTERRVRRAAALGRTLPFDEWLSNVRYRFLSPVSCHSAIGQSRPYCRTAPMAVVHRRDASSCKRTLIVLATYTGRLFRYKVELVAFGISASTLERNSFRIGEVFALL